MPENLGERIADAAAAPDYAGDGAEAGALFSSNAGVPGAVFVSFIRLDTTNKLCYAWDGAQYVKIADYA